MSWRALGLWPAAGFAVVLCGVIALMGIHGEAARHPAMELGTLEPSESVTHAAAELPAPEAAQQTPTRDQRGEAESGSALATSPLHEPALEADPMDLASAVIDSMTTDELLDLLSEVTRREREELEEELRDPHAFAKALALAILSGWATEAAAAEGGTLPIRFDTRLANLESDAPGGVVFPSSTSRLFGTFAMEPGEELTVLAKWYRVDPPEFLLLEEVRVLEREGRGFIRLDRPEGWPAGLYRLELYESSEALEPVAKGEYRTIGNQGPLLAAFD